MLYLLLAGSLFVACSSGGEDANNNNTNTSVPSTDPAASTTPSDPNAMANDPNAMNMPPEPTPGNAAFEFEKTEHDFGTIKTEANVEYTFKFKNTGTEPLIISEARGSCGCTVPEYSKEPIPVGGDGVISVSFDPKGKSGIQRKTVTITANTNPARTTINIVSDVQLTPAAN